MRSFLQDLQLERLPEDIVGHVLSIFSIRELSSFLFVCTEWRKWVSAALLVRRVADNVVPLSRVRTQSAGESCIRYMNFLGTYCSRLRYVDLTANCVTIGPLLALLSRTRHLEFFATGDVLTDVSAILPRTADYETRYESSRLATYGNNLKVVIDHLHKYCPNISMLCLQTMVDSEAVSKIVEYFPDLKGVQLGGLSLTSTYDDDDVLSLFSECSSLQVFNLLCSRTGPLWRILDAVPVDNNYLRYLAAPYCDVSDTDCDSLADWGRHLRELNLGCDLLTVRGLETLIRSCKDLRSLCLTMATHQDFIGMLHLLANNGSLPHLSVLGIRSPRGIGASALAILREKRPHIKIYEYRDKPRVEDEWCYPRFNFSSVCAIAGLLDKIRPQSLS